MTKEELSQFFLGLTYRVKVLFSWSFEDDLRHKEQAPLAWASQAVSEAVQYVASQNIAMAIAEHSEMQIWRMHDACEYLKHVLMLAEESEQHTKILGSQLFNT